MTRFYRPIKWISSHRDMRIPVDDAGPKVRRFDDPDLRFLLNTRVLGAYLENDEWMVDVKFGKHPFGKGIFPGRLIIDRSSTKIFVRLNDFLGAQTEIFLE